MSNPLTNIHPELKKALALDNNTKLMDFSQKCGYADYRFVIQVAQGKKKSKNLRNKIEKYINKTSSKYGVDLAA